MIREALDRLKYWIFQPGKAVQQDGGGLLPAYKSNDTTHVRSSRNSEFEQR